MAGTQSPESDHNSTPAASRTDDDAGHLVVFDTTLRDGEQSPGISLDAGEKLEIAEQLARLGVDYIEAGFPVASVGDFEAVQAIARSVGNGPSAPVIAGLSRTNVSDVDRCWEALRDSARARIHVFISTSPQHMEHMLKMTREQVLAETTKRSEPRPRAHLRRGVQPAGRHEDAARLHARGPERERRGRSDDAQHPRHGRLRDPLGLRSPDPVHTPRGTRRLRPVDALS